MARLILAAGGTGGHVYPALAAAEVLRKSADNEHKLVFVGTRGGGGFERDLVARSGIPFDSFAEVFAGPIVGVHPLRAFSSSILMFLGVLQSFWILFKHRPQAILLTGGWANVPLALAAAILRIPMLIYLPDIEPGSTIKVLSKFAQKIAITVSASEQYFKAGQTVVTGYPLREEVTNASREKAIAHFQLDPKRKTLLVTGGSRGAQTINLAVEAILSAALQENLQIIHVTGTFDWERSQAAVGAKSAHYHAYAYLDSPEMGLAFAAADIVLGRSGASVLGEFPYFGAASLLVPYPYAWRYQKVNADWLVEHGAGIRIDDEKMASELLPTLQTLVRDSQKLATMQANARQLHQGNGAENIAQELLKLVPSAEV